MGGMRDTFIIEARLFVVLGGSNLGTSQVFMACVSRNGSLIEDSKCGCLSLKLLLPG